MTAVATPPRAAETPADDLRRIPLAELHESPLNPRTRYDQRALEELRDSLLQSGQLTPLLARPRKAGGYELAAGHRRYRAAKLAVQASPDGAAFRGLKELLVIVRHMDDRTFIEVLNIENLQRDDLHPLEEAQGFRDLMEKAGYDIAKIAARVGRSAKYVYDRVKLLQLVPEAKRMFLAGEFEAGHAIILARLKPDVQRNAIDKGGAEWYARKGGLWQTEAADEDPNAPVQARLEIEDAVKPVSVRELAAWVHDNVRMKPEDVDAFLFPETASVLRAAEVQKTKIVHITHDYRVPDAARDEKQRTYGENSWKRADGKHKSKTCEYAVVGIVVAGPGQGEAFRVCVRKDKCKTHWAKEQRQLAADRKWRERNNAGGARQREDYAAQEARQREQQKREEAERARWKKAIPALQKALVEKIRTVPIAVAIAELLERRYDAKLTEKLLPAGRTPETVLRHLALDLLLDDAFPSWDLADVAAKELKRFGIDAKKIVDQVVPPPQPEKPTKKPAKKKGAR